VVKHRDKWWDPEGVSKNSGIKLEDIEKHPEMQWDWVGYQIIQTLRCDFVLKHPDKVLELVFIIKKSKYHIEGY
jgi:hypothetical protein